MNSRIAMVTLLMVGLLLSASAQALDQPVREPPQNGPSPLLRLPAAGVPGQRSSSPSLIPQRYLAGIPDCMQMNNSSCGVGAFQAVAMHFGYWGYQDEFAKILGTTPDQGTHPSRIVKGFKQLGFDAAMVEGLTIERLREHIRLGEVVIIDYQAWGEPAGKDYSKEWEDGHYSIAVGYNDRVIFIEDPSLFGTVGYLTNEELMSRWHDYENDQGKRREYVQMGIVVRGRGKPQSRFTHID